MTWSERLQAWVDHYYRWLASLVALLVVGGGCYFLLWPQFNTLQASGVVQYQSVIQIVEQRRNYLHDLQVMATNYEALDQRLLRSFDSILPPHYSEASLFAEIEALFKNTALSLDSINIATVTGQANPAETIALPAAIDQPYEQIMVTVNVSADSLNYQNFKIFLQQLENYNHVIDLESFAYTPDNTAFTLVLKTYRRLPTTL